MCTTGYAAAGLAEWHYTAIECAETELADLVRALGPEWGGLSLTMPLEMVWATLVDRNAPARLSTPLMRTATFGRSAPVAIEVAIALAVSWKPLVKSNASAVMITTITNSEN